MDKLSKEGYGIFACNEAMYMEMKLRENEGGKRMEDSDISAA